MRNEAVAISAVIAGGLLLLLQVARAFGISVTDSQTQAVSDFLYSPMVDLVIVAIMGFVARSNVYSRASAEKLTGEKEPIVPAVVGPAPRI